MVFYLSVFLTKNVSVLVVPVCATSKAHHILLHILALTVSELNTFPRAALQTY
jgi:hypothetical protein